MYSAVLLKRATCEIFRQTKKKNNDKSNCKQQNFSILSELLKQLTLSQAATIIEILPYQKRSFSPQPKVESFSSYILA